MRARCIEIAFSFVLGELDLFLLSFLEILISLLSKVRSFLFCLSKERTVVILLVYRTIFFFLLQVV